jgi:Chlorophyll A-B binding protein
MKPITIISVATVAAWSMTTTQALVVGGKTLSRPTMRLYETVNTDEAVMESTPEAVMPPMTSSLPAMSQALPFLPRPVGLDGSMVGDVGFDPLGFARNSPADLLNYREAEIKHGRLAMLAAVGWPLSELFDAKIAATLNLPAVVDGSDRAPSLLNGGLGQISPIYWGVVLGLGAAIDLYGISRSKANDPAYFAGNLGFDPLGLYPKNAAGQERMQLAELKNGRLAMIAITAFAVQEFVQKLGVVDETPVFFKPLGTVLSEYANSGYLLPGH